MDQNGATQNGRPIVWIIRSCRRVWTIRSCRRRDPPGQLGGMLAGTSIGDMLNGGLRDLVNGFKQAGHGEAADSWVSRGPNKQIAPSQLEQAIGPEVLATLSEQTGLSREEILARLSKNLPDAVDKYTPDGRIPTTADLSKL